MDKDESLAWLTWLYGEQFEGKVWIGGHADGFVGRRFSDLHEAVDYAAALDAAAGWGVYHRLTTMSADASGRGKAEDSISLPALMMDLDIRGPGHVSDLYPASRDDIEKILDVAGTPPPTTWIESGGGLYATWKLDRPEPVHGSEETLKAAQQASRALHRGVITAAKSLGFKIDNTSDLARVFRLPGTANRKPGMPDGLRARWCSASVASGFALAEIRARPVHEPVNNTPVVRASEVEDSSAVWGGGLTALFGQSAGAGAPHAGTRGFTVEQAMAFVAPALDALRKAADGEINVRLNAAACALAHFGPEFWDEGAADRQLESALSATVYDGATWRAADTIASARRAMSGGARDAWRAVLVASAPDPLASLPVATADAVEALLAEMLGPDEITSRPPPKFMIHGLLQFDSESWIIGPAGSKKSFTVLDMIARVVRGEPWQGRRTHPADVVMIVAEGAGGTGKRIKAWEKRYGRLPAELRILPRPVQAGRPEAWAVLVEACRRLADSARERDRGLFVVLDTQARVTVGLKENDATDMGMFVGALSAIREATGACVGVVHHTGRAGGDARGSSAIDGAQTTELKVVADKGRLTGKLIVEKQKDIEEIEPIRLAFESVHLGQDEDGQDVTSLVLCEQDSTAFQLAWSDGEVTAEGVALESKKDTNPFSVRVVVDPWIRERTTATYEQWAMQALWDIAEDEGLTGPEVRRAAEEKVGKKIPDASWYEAWQRITNTTKEEGAKRRWNDVVRPAGGRRWTVDKLGQIDNPRTSH